MDRCKTCKHSYTPTGNKKPKTDNSNAAEKWKNKNPVWRFHRFDGQHEKWGIENFNFPSILGQLASFERMNWQEIENVSGGRSSGTNHHFLPAARLDKKAVKRLQELKLTEFSDNIFSLRLNGKHRLIGILMNGTFDILWNDYDHEVCPSQKRNT